MHDLTRIVDLHALSRPTDFGGRQLKSLLPPVLRAETRPIHPEMQERRHGPSFGKTGKPPASVYKNGRLQGRGPPNDELSAAPLIGRGSIADRGLRRTSSRQAERQPPPPHLSIGPDHEKRPRRTRHPDPPTDFGANGWPNEVQIKDVPLLHRVDPRVNGDRRSRAAVAQRDSNQPPQTGRARSLCCRNLYRVRTMAALPRVFT